MASSKIADRLPASMPTDRNDAYVSFVDLVRSLLEHKWVVLVTMLFFLVASILYGATATKIYRAELVLIYQDQERMDSRLAGLAQQFGAIASFAGMNLNASSSGREEALATLRSSGFIQSFIADKNLLPLLFSGKWDASQSDWSVDDAKDIPTLQDGSNLFKRRVLSVSEDLNTGLITLVVDWRDPATAAEWANELVARVNNRLQKRAISEAGKSMEYLSKELEKAAYVELRNAIFDLIEGQIHSIMLANVRDQYAFRIVDPATAPDNDKYIRPNRFLLAIGGTFFGLVLGVFLIFLLNFSRQIRAC